MIKWIGLVVILCSSGLIAYALYLGDVELVTALVEALADALRALNQGG